MTHRSKQGPQARPRPIIVVKSPLISPPTLLVPLFLYVQVLYSYLFGVLILHEKLSWLSILGSGVSLNSFAAYLHVCCGPREFFSLCTITHTQAYAHTHNL